MHETPMRGCDYTNKFEGLMLNHVRWWSKEELQRGCLFVSATRCLDEVSKPQTWRCDADMPESSVRNREVHYFASLHVQWWEE